MQYHSINICANVSEQDFFTLITCEKQGVKYGVGCVTILDVKVASESMLNVKPKKNIYLYSVLLSELFCTASTQAVQSDSQTNGSNKTILFKESNIQLNHSSIY